MLLTMRKIDQQQVTCQKGKNH